MELSDESWRTLLYLAHENKSEAFQRYADYYLSTNTQLYWSDTHQMSFYPENYHRLIDQKLHAKHPATEIITEINVPRDRLEDFLAEVKDDFRKNEVELIYGTVRLIERDDESFLPWAKQPYACTIFNLHTVHTPEGIRHSADAFRRLILISLSAGTEHIILRIIVMPAATRRLPPIRIFQSFCSSRKNMTRKNSFRAIGTGITKPCSERQVDYRARSRCSSQEILFVAHVPAISLLSMSLRLVSGRLFQREIPTADGKMVLRPPALPRASRKPRIPIIFLYGKVCWDFARDKGYFVRPNRRLGINFLIFGWLYLGAMVFRYIIRMALYPDQRWTGDRSPSSFIGYWLHSSW